MQILSENHVEQFEAAINYARIFIRTAGENAILKDQILGMLALAPESADSLSLHGEYNLMLNNVKKAQEYFNRAMAMDSTQVSAFTGLVWCCLKLGNKKRALQQLEMARTMFETNNVGKALDFHLLDTVPFSVSLRP